MSSRPCASSPRSLCATPARHTAASAGASMDRNPPLTRQARPDNHDGRRLQRDASVHLIPVTALRRRHTVRRRSMSHLYLQTVTRRSRVGHSRWPTSSTRRRSLTRPHLENLLSSVRLRSVTCDDRAQCAMVPRLISRIPQRPIRRHRMDRPPSLCPTPGTLLPPSAPSRDIAPSIPHTLAPASASANCRLLTL